MSQAAIASLPNGYNPGKLYPPQLDGSHLCVCPCMIRLQRLKLAHTNMRSSSMQELPPAKVMELLDKVAQGDASAVETLYRSFSRPLYAFVRMRIDDDATTQALVDDTFMVVFKAPGRFSQQSSFKTWLFGIAKNLCNDWIRKQTRQPSSLPIDEADPLSMHDESMPAFDRVAEKEIREIIRRCLSRLPDTQRDAVYWVFYEEDSLGQIAQRMNCPEGTIKSRLFHARGNLARCVKRALGSSEGGLL